MHVSFDKHVSNKRSRCAMCKHGLIEEIISGSMRRVTAILSWLFLGTQATILDQPYLDPDYIAMKSDYSDLQNYCERWHFAILIHGDYRSIIKITL